MGVIKEMHTKCNQNSANAVAKSGSQGMRHRKDTICVRVWMMIRSLRREKSLGKKPGQGEGRGNKECKDKGTHGL